MVGVDDRELRLQARLGSGLGVPRRVGLEDAAELGVEFVEDADEHLHTFGGKHFRVRRIGGQARERRLEDVLKR